MTTKAFSTGQLVDAITNNGTGVSITGTANISGLTASSAVATDASKNLVSVTNTGTGNNVLATNPTLAGETNSGNLTFTGTGNRITGDFSNATASSRVSFQTSATNSSTIVQTIPNGSATGSFLLTYGSSDLSGTSTGSVGYLYTNNADIRLASDRISSSGTYLPMTFYTSGSEAMRIDTNRNVQIASDIAGGRTFAIQNNDAGVGSYSYQRLTSNNGSLQFQATSTAAGGLSTIYASTTTGLQIYTTTTGALLLGVNSVNRLSLDSSGNILNISTGGLGYGTGSGGTVTQTGTRTTGVTLNTTNGAITLVSAAGSTTIAAFTVTNSTVAATDVVHVTQKSGTDKYRIYVTNTAAGSFQISFATLAGTTTEQPVFNFCVLKAVTA